MKRALNGVTCLYVKILFKTKSHLFAKKKQTSWWIIKGFVFTIVTSMVYRETRAKEKKRIDRVHISKERFLLHFLFRKIAKFKIKSGLTCWWGFSQWNLEWNKWLGKLHFPVSGLNSCLNTPDWTLICDCNHRWKKKKSPIDDLS